MTDKKLTILGVIAIVMVILVGLQSGLIKKGNVTPTQQGYLIQGLNTDNVASILIGAGEEQVILTRADSRFVIANKDDYPAQTKQVNDLFAQCLDVKTLELVTGNSKNHQEIGVTETTARYVIKFLDSKNELLTGLFISSTNPETSNVFARLVLSDDVYQVENAPWLYTKPLDYVDKLLMGVNSDGISSVTVATPSDDYTLSAIDGSENIAFENITEDKSLKQDVAKQIFSAITNIRFSDLQKVSLASDLDFDSTYTCRLEDSTIYTISIARRKNTFFIKCDAEFTDKTEVTMNPNAVHSEEELKAKEAKLLAKEAARDFAKKHTGWIYEIPAFQAENLTKKTSDLLEEKTEPKQDEITNVLDN
jgi:Domain of unknown function (DUF4340)